MFGIYHDIYIEASIEEVFELLSTAQGLEKWWTSISKGKTEEGGTMQLYFNEEYDWEAKFEKIKHPTYIEYQMTRAYEHWLPTKIKFELEELNTGCMLHFTHDHWDTVDAHFRRCSYSWAMYLRILKRYLELREFIPYSKRTKS